MSLESSSVTKLGLFDVAFSRCSLLLSTRTQDLAENYHRCVLATYLCIPSSTYVLRSLGLFFVSIEVQCESVASVEEPCAASFVLGLRSDGANVHS